MKIGSTGGGNEIFGFDFDKKYEYENGFYLTTDIPRIGKLIAHYELYRKSLGISGSIIECGVYKGASLIRWATFRELLESQYSRKIIAFDMFGEFPHTQCHDDNVFIENFEKNGDGIDVESLHAIFEKKGFVNYELIKGDITETIDSYLKQHPELKISLLHIDVDVYAPSKVILDKLYSHVAKGGLIVLDDYGSVHGETRALDEFIEREHLQHKLEKLPYYYVPTYIVK